jgi:hypothetical protein
VFKILKRMRIKVDLHQSQLMMLVLLIMFLLSACSPSNSLAATQKTAATPATETLTPSETAAETPLPTATPVPTETAVPQISEVPESESSQDLTGTAFPAPQTTGVPENSTSSVTAWRDGIEAGIYMSNACNYFVSQLEDYQAGKQNQDATRVGLLNASLWATIGQEKLKGWDLSKRTSLAEISSQLTAFADQLVDLSAQWTMGFVTASDVLDLISPQCQAMEAHMETITSAASEDGVTDEDLKTIIDELFMPMAQQ